MEFTYRNRKHIAKVALVSLAFILLLGLNLKIYGGTYDKGDFEGIIANQLKDLEHCILSNIDHRESVNNTVQIKRLLDTGYNIIVDCILLIFTHFIWIFRSKLLWERRHTLVSLCVRMNE